MDHHIGCGGMDCSTGVYPAKVWNFNLNEEQLPVGRRRRPEAKSAKKKLKIIGGMLAAVGFRKLDKVFANQKSRVFGRFKSEVGRVKILFEMLLRRF